MRKQASNSVLSGGGNAFARFHGMARYEYSWHGGDATISAALRNCEPCSVLTSCSTSCAGYGRRSMSKPITSQPSASRPSDQPPSPQNRSIASIYRLRPVTSSHSSITSTANTRMAPASSTVLGFDAAVVEAALDALHKLAQVIERQRDHADVVVAEADE